MKEVFPKAELLCFFEWFYHPRGSDADFDPSEPLNADDLCRIRVKNTPILIDFRTYALTGSTKYGVWVSGILT
jgi:hypothetical protein